MSGDVHRPAAGDLVIVSSPLQYMNAVEQRASMGGGLADLVLIGDRHGAGDVIAALARRHAPWRGTHFHARRPRPPGGAPRLVKDALDALHRASLERLARTFSGRTYDSVVIGDYRNVSQRLIAARVPHRRFVLLDDGSVTPQAAAFRADPATAPEPRQFDLKWFRGGAAKALLGDAPLAEPDVAIFFTIYRALLAGRMRPGDRTVANTYAVWGGGAVETPRGSETWLLGSDHAEAGICSTEAYRRLVLNGVAALRSQAAGPILYRPHRGESREKVEALAREAGLALGTSAAPVELDYLDAPERPARIAVVASSAADTLAVIDPELDIVRLALPENYLVRRGDHIRAVIAAHHAFNPRLRTIEATPAGAREG